MTHRIFKKPTKPPQPTPQSPNKKPLSPPITTTTSSKPFFESQFSPFIIRTSPPSPPRNSPHGEKRCHGRTFISPPIHCVIPQNNFPINPDSSSDFSKPSEPSDLAYSDSGDFEDHYANVSALYMATNVTQTDPRTFESKTSRHEEPLVEKLSDHSTEEIRRLDVLVEPYVRPTSEP